MNDRSDAPPPADGPGARPAVEPGGAALARFFAESRAARAAASSLRGPAEVRVTFAGEAGEFRFFAEGGAPRLVAGPPRDPDFELELAPGAVRAICARPDAGVGDLGVLFFQHILAREPEDKVRVKLHSGLLKLTLRGWLGVVAQGGGRVVGWMAQKGLKGPGAVAAAIGRLKR